MSLFKLKHYLLIAAVVLADQLTKNWAATTLKFLEETVIIPKLLSFQLVFNYGAAYGIFQHQRVFLLSITVFIIALGLLFAKHIVQSKWSLIGLALIMAGALGNFIDRASLGYVIDFIYIHIIPNFNIADMSINAGVSCFIIEYFAHGNSDSRK